MYYPPISNAEGIPWYDVIICDALYVAEDIVNSFSWNTLNVFWFEFNTE